MALLKSFDSFRYRVIPKHAVRNPCQMHVDFISRFVWGLNRPQHATAPWQLQAVT